MDPISWIYESLFHFKKGVVYLLVYIYIADVSLTFVFGADFYLVNNDLTNYTMIMHMPTKRGTTQRAQPKSMRREKNEWRAKLENSMGITEYSVKFIDFKSVVSENRLSLD